MELVQALMCISAKIEEYLCLRKCTKNKSEGDEEK